MCLHPQLSMDQPFDSEASYSGFLGKNVTSHSLDDWFRRRFIL